MPLPQQGSLSAQTASRFGGWIAARIRILPRTTGQFDSMNPAVFWSFAILGLFVWMLFRPYSMAPWKILAVIIAVFAMDALTRAALKAMVRAYPLKYDYVLQSLDQALGLTAFQIARLFTPWQSTALLAIYQFLTIAMIAWYGIHLVIRGGEPRKLLYAYLIVFLVGGCLYGVVPAMGPRYAFGALFPMENPNVAPVPALLEGNPNAMPSLHVATALLLLALFSVWLGARAVTVQWKGPQKMTAGEPEAVLARP